jgi:hypothetical protein
MDVATILVDDDPESRLGTTTGGQLTPSTPDHPEWMSFVLIKSIVSKAAHLAYWLGLRWPVYPTFATQRHSARQSGATFASCRNWWTAIKMPAHRPRGMYNVLGTAALRPQNAQLAASVKNANRIGHIGAAFSVPTRLPNEFCST